MQIVYVFVNSGIRIFVVMSDVLRSRWHRSVGVNTLASQQRRPGLITGLGPSVWSLHVHPVLVIGCRVDRVHVCMQVKVKSVD